MVVGSSEFHLTLKRAHRAHFFPTRNTPKKRDILSEKRESEMTLKKREFTSESGTVDTYGRLIINTMFLVSLHWFGVRARHYD